MVGLQVPVGQGVVGQVCRGPGADVGGPPPGLLGQSILGGGAVGKHEGAVGVELHYPLQWARLVCFGIVRAGRGGAGQRAQAWPASQPLSG